MTESAGPDNIVNTGRRFISVISITPPSPRMIINGTVTPACRTAFSVDVAVFSIFGKILALITAVRVRRVKPYSFVISDAIVEGIFFCFATLETSSSGPISSTPNAMEETMTSADSCFSAAILSPILSSDTSFSFRNSLAI